MGSHHVRSDKKSPSRPRTRAGRDPVAVPEGKRVVAVGRYRAIGKTCLALQLCLSASDLGDVPQAGSLWLNFSLDCGSISRTDYEERRDDRHARRGGLRPGAGRGRTWAAGDEVADHPTAPSVASRTCSRRKTPGCSATDRPDGRKLDAGHLGVCRAGESIAQFLPDEGADHAVQGESSAGSASICTAPSIQEADRPTGRRRAGVPPTRHRARRPTARSGLRRRVSTRAHAVAPINTSRVST